MPPPRGSRRVFGQAMGKPKNSSTRYQQQFGGGIKAKTPNDSDDSNALLAAKRRAHQQKAEEIDAKFGYETFAFQNSNDSASREVLERRGWLFNMLPTTVSSLALKEQLHIWLC